MVILTKEEPAAGMLTLHPREAAVLVPEYKSEMSVLSLDTVEGTLILLIFLVWKTPLHMML